MQEQIKTDATFPERIYELARDHQVGVPVKAYRLALFWWLVGVSIWIAFFTIFLPLSIHEYTLHKAEAQKSAQFFASCQGCTHEDRDLDSQVNGSLLSEDIQSIQNSVAEIVSGLLVLALLLYARQKLFLYRCSEGLLWSLRKKDTLVLHWDKIAEVYWKGDRIRALHEADAKRELDLTRFLEIQDISECVESEVTPRLFAQALEQYKQTGNVYLDFLSIEREGLAINENNPAISWDNGERVVPWQDLEDIRFVDGILSIKLQGKWRGWIGSLRRQKRLSRTIPNPTVYVALAKYMLENGRIEEKRIGE